MNRVPREPGSSQGRTSSLFPSLQASHFSPEEPAIVSGDAVISYGELDDRSTRLAELLKERGVDSRTVVGVSFPRSIELVVSMLALWKAGGIYLPLDPNFPQRRIRFMTVDAKTKIVIAEESSADWFAGSDVLVLDCDARPLSRWFDMAKRPVDDSLADLAYIIYTSGSTGRPKGVMIKCSSFANFVCVVGKLATPANKRKVMWLTPVSFDMSFKALSLLFHGGVLHIPPDELRIDTQACVDYMKENQIDLLPCTPGLVEQLIRSGLLEHVGTKEHPLLLWLGGEAISDWMWALLRKTATIRALNMYGPTECTIDATTCWLNDEEEPNIGKPIDNVQVYLLDESGTPVEHGAVGEIHIGGVGVARGYVNQPALTADRFVFDSLGRSQCRLYRTGDLGRRRLDGAIEFVGRIDDQVKIRGYRVELGEIEACLRRCGGVQDAIVIVLPLPNGDPRLHAYLTGEEILAEKLRSALAEDLPEYMIPSVFTRLEKLPLNANGKVDRKLLVQYAKDWQEAGRSNLAEDFVAPRNQIEQEICAVWREVLHIERVGIHHDFFAVGGHSLLAIRAIARLRRSLGVPIPVHLFFEHRTIADFASAILAYSDGGSREELSRAEAGGRKKTGSPIAQEQRKQYFFWIPRPVEPDQCALRLFCLPHAGGNVETFTDLAHRLPLGIELWAVHLPGRGTRSGENTPDTFDDLVLGLSALIRNHIDGPFAVLGQSFGGIVAYEICCQLAPDLEPVLLGVTAAHPPHLLQPVDRLSRDDLIFRLRSQHRIAPEMLKNLELAETFFSAIETDRHLIGTYTTTNRSQLRCPIHVFVGDEDRDVRPEKAAAWSDYTSGRFNITALRCNHLVLPDQSRSVADVLGMRLGGQ